MNLAATTPAASLCGPPCPQRIPKLLDHAVVGMEPEASTNAVACRAMKGSQVGGVHVEVRRGREGDGKSKGDCATTL
jgi:hypothetical protein